MRRHVVVAIAIAFLMFLLLLWPRQEQEIVPVVVATPVVTPVATLLVEQALATSRAQPARQTIEALYYWSGGELTDATIVAVLTAVASTPTP